MDDFVLSNLNTARDEFSARLVSILTPLVIEGVKSIFLEAWRMCQENKEESKYLMVFQNLLSRIVKWNSVIVEEEVKRIKEKSGCGYLEDLITCVHIIQLKALTCVRVGNKQKKIDISIPKLDTFVHKVYINVARKVYMNVFLFEKHITPLQVQKNHRELEIIVQECILTTIRESIPTEQIIRAYLEESVEHEEVVTIEKMEDPVVEGGSQSPVGDAAAEGSSDTDISMMPPPKDDGDSAPSVVPSIQNKDDNNVITKLAFNDIDSVLHMETNEVKQVEAPKSIDRLEEISTSRAISRKLMEEEDEDDKIRILTDDIKLTDIFDIDKSLDTTNTSENIMLDFEDL
jgi:hypothetical protein